MALTYTNPGAAAGGAFENFMLQRQAQERQSMIDDLAQKREQRLAQAELDSHAEHQDEMARKQAKDAADLHDHRVKQFEDMTKNMVKGDRPTPEMLDQEKALGLHVFTQPAAPTSVTPMQPPAALMEQPPTGAPAEGVEQPTPAGALQPQPVAFPGSFAERTKDADQAKAKAFIDSMDDSDPRKAELKTAFEAENAGLKVPAGYFSKGAGTGTDEAVMRQNTKTGAIERLIDGSWTAWTKDVPKGAHWMTEAQPKDDSAHVTANANALQRAKEHAFKRLNDDMGKGDLAKIAASDDISSALASNTTVADATLAPLVLKASITAGGNSGFRMTRPEIEAVLTKPVWDALKLKLDAWTGEGPLILTPEQKVQIRKLGAAIRRKAAKSYSEILDAEDEVNAAEDASSVNAVVTKVKRKHVLTPPEDTVDTNVPPPVKGRVRYDESGMLIPAGGQ